MDTPERSIGFIGLGYAGFPMASLLSKYFKVTGFDRSSERIAELLKGHDKTLCVSSEDIKKMLDGGSSLTDNLDDLKKCNFYIVTVPTPVYQDNIPDLTCLIEASNEVGRVLKRGDIVVFESTVFPGATEEVCVPVIEQVSGLKVNIDFFVGYSPERINPGDRLHTLTNTVKVISASAPEALPIIKDVYESVTGPGNTFSVSSIKVAEACKVLENTQRDVNIALMNEAAMIFDAMDINTDEVVEAMNTKWNALGFIPGLVGGHCIGIDPYYLIDKASKLGVDPVLMNVARRVNNSMPRFVARKTIDFLVQKMDKAANTARILLLGFSFKENCPDTRNTKVVDIFSSLKQRVNDIVILDPWADAAQVKKDYGIDIVTRLDDIADQRFDAIVICVSHDDFRQFDFASHLTPDGFVYDIKGFFPANYKTKFEINKI